VACNSLDVENPVDRASAIQGQPCQGKARGPHSSVIRKDYGAAPLALAITTYSHRIIEANDQHFRRGRCARASSTPAATAPRLPASSRERHAMGGPAASRHGANPPPPAAPPPSSIEIR